jgi:hypothetical protein
VLQVQFEHQAAARVRADAALDQHRAGMVGQQALGKVAAHRGLDARDACRRIGRAQVDLGEDQVQRRRRIADLAFHLLPVQRFGGVLVAGDHRPLRHVEAGPRQA